jgi:nitrogen regulatory protein P-II 1
MRLITAIIRPERLGAVKAALLREGVGGLTLTRASGHGGEKDLVQHWRAASVVLAFHEKVKVEVAVADAQVDGVLLAIQEAARTGQVGDGKIFVQALERVVRIRTGEQDGEALHLAPMKEVAS